MYAAAHVLLGCSGDKGAAGTAYEPGADEPFCRGHAAGAMMHAAMRSQAAAEAGDVPPSPGATARHDLLLPVIAIHSVRCCQLLP